MLLRDLAEESEKRMPEGGSLVEADASKLARAKWLVIRSNLLGGEEILLVFNEIDADEAAKILPGKVIYHPPEVEELGRHSDDPELLRRVHMFKKRFDGEVVPSDSAMASWLRWYGIGS